MLLSVAEGDDKPLKYPLIFHESLTSLGCCSSTKWISSPMWTSMSRRCGRSP
jgi:hypothetical protein